MSAPAAIVHIPMVAGAVVVTSNLPGNPELKFTPDVVADIFLGKIKKWNDRADRGDESRREAARHEHHSRAPLGRQRHDGRFHRLPLQGFR